MTMLAPSRAPGHARRRAANEAWISRMARDCAVMLVFASVVSIFLISDMALSAFGFSYGEVGGNFLEKVHPGTWLALGTLFAIACGRGNPFRVIDMIAAYRGVAIFLVCWVALVAYAIFVSKAPFTPLIDTFFLPILLVVLIGWLSKDARRSLALALHAVLLVNALIGIYEYVANWRLTPFMIGGLELTTDWRSTALLGHPLGNAAVMGSYIIALASGGGRDLPKIVRPACLGLALISMVAFGGRSSLVVALALLGVCGVGRALRVARGGKLDIATTSCLFLAAPFLGMLLYYAAQTGFFDLFVERFVDDKGSAKARVIMLNLFGMLSWQDLLLGPDQAYLGSLQALEGIEFGIESFWVGFIMTHGIIMALYFFAALGVFCRQLVVETRTATILPLIFYFIIASTAVSMSAKTTIFGMFVAIVLTMMRRDEPLQRATSAARGAAT